jgi:hypothetical protein
MSYEEWREEAIMAPIVEGKFTSNYFRIGLTFDQDGNPGVKAMSAFSQSWPLKAMDRIIAQWMARVMDQTIQHLLKLSETNDLIEEE